jgi:hypothetical protein
VERIRAHAETRLAELQSEIEINAELRMATGDDFDLPPIEIPKAEVDPTSHGRPLVSSAWDWADQTAALRNHKAYADGADSDAPA